MLDSNAPYRIGYALSGSVRAIGFLETGAGLEQAIDKARKWTPGSRHYEVVIVDRRGHCVARFVRDDS